MDSFESTHPLNNSTNLDEFDMRKHVEGGSNVEFVTSSTLEVYYMYRKIMIGSLWNWSHLFGLVVPLVENVWEWKYGRKFMLRLFKPELRKWGLLETHYRERESNLEEQVSIYVGNNDGGSIEMSCQRPHQKGIEREGLSPGILKLYYPQLVHPFEFMELWIDEWIKLESLLVLRERRLN